MMVETLNLIKQGMEELGLEYEFGTYNGNPVKYPYWVGEYQEFESTTEDGLHESTFVLNGFSRDAWKTLELSKEKIESYFGIVSGKTAITNNGSGVAVFYSNALIVPTGDAELKRMQINLNVKEWKVN